MRETVPIAQDEESRMGIKEFNGWDEDFSSAITPDTYVDNSTTLLDEVVDATRAEALARGQSAHRVWLPPLPQAIELPAVAADFVPEEGVGIQAPIGIIDRPYYQRQDPLMVDLTSGHMALCGGPQSGKSTALRTIVASLAAAYSPEFLRFYVIDLGGGQLSALERLPHVAAVAGRHEDEKVRRIIDEVSGLVDFPEARHTFLVIDGWHAIGTSGAEFEDLSEALTRLAADGPSAHVHVIISTPRWTTMRPAIRDLISERLELKLGEPMDSLFDRKKQQKLPSAPGRGITPAGEFFLFASTSRQDIAHIETSWANVAPVPKLKMLPQQLTVADLDPSAVDIPWALGGRDLDTQHWDTRMNFVVIGTSGVGKSSLLATLLQGIAAKDSAEARIVLIDERRAHLGTIEQSMLAAYSATSAATEKVVRDTATTLKARLPGPDVTPAQSLPHAAGGPGRIFTLSSMTLTWSVKWRWRPWWSCFRMPAILACTLWLRGKPAESGAHCSGSSCLTCAIPNRQSLSWIPRVMKARCLESNQRISRLDAGNWGLVGSWSGCARPRCRCSKKLKTKQGMKVRRCRYMNPPRSISPSRC